MSALRQAINFADNPKHGGAGYTLKIRTKVGQVVSGALVEFHDRAALLRVTERAIASIGGAEGVGFSLNYAPDIHRDVFVDETAVETVEVCW